MSAGPSPLRTSAESARISIQGRASAFNAMKRGESSCFKSFALRRARLIWTLFAKMRSAERSGLGASAAIRFTRSSSTSQSRTRPSPRPIQRSSRCHSSRAFSGITSANTRSAVRSLRVATRMSCTYSGSTPARVPGSYQNIRASWRPMFFTATSASRSLWCGVKGLSSSSGTWIPAASSSPARTSSTSLIWPGPTSSEIRSFSSRSSIRFSFRPLRGVRGGDLAQGARLDQPFERSVSRAGTVRERDERGAALLVRDGGLALLSDEKIGSKSAQVRLVSHDRHALGAELSQERDRAAEIPARHEVVTELDLHVGSERVAQDLRRLAGPDQGARDDPVRLLGELPQSARGQAKFVHSLRRERPVIVALVRGIAVLHGDGMPYDQ